jgi:multicomponent Na+:H+ antiporter subunit D
LADIAARLGPAASDFAQPLYAALAFLAVGICLKLALFPLHLWLPNAYAYAPSAVTVFLAGSATKVAVYLLVRIYFSLYGAAFGIENLPVSLLLLVLSLAAMVIASFSAIFEHNAKRMLANSSVAQIGYITLGIALANVSGLTGGLAHLANHAVTKAALFMALGAVAFRLGSVQLADMAGLGRRMPLTSAALVIGGLSLIGVPGTAGFISKWYLVLAALEKGYWPVAFLIVGSSLLALVYVGRLLEAAYFRAPSEAAKEARDPPLWMLLPLSALSLLSVYLGFETSLSAGLARAAAEMLVGGLR